VAPHHSAPTINLPKFASPGAFPVDPLWRFCNDVVPKVGPNRKRAPWTLPCARVKSGET
jgi:hypothetical protein